MIADAKEDESSVGAPGMPGSHARPPNAHRMQSWKARALDAFGEPIESGRSDTSEMSGGRLVTVVMSPLAVDLVAGERLRLHVCSAAHPRWMRNVLADPSVPLHEQCPPEGKGARATVQLSVDDRESCLTLPVIE